MIMRMWPKMTNRQIVEKLIEKGNLLEAAHAAIYLKGDLPAVVRREIEKKEDVSKLLDVYENLLLVDSRDDFDCFCRFIDFGAQTPVRQFYLPRRKYLKTVADALEDVEDGKTEVLRIKMVRRSGKSEISISRFLSWYVGKHPEKENLACVGGGRLADTLFLKAKSMWTEYEDQYLKVFPEMTVSNVSNKDRILWVNRDSEYGNISVVSVGEDYEGRVQCTGILLIDDIVNEEVLNNKFLLERQYTHDILDRLFGRRLSGQIIIIGTPQHPDDAPQRLYDDMRESGVVCREISIPAIDSSGESNYEYDKAVLERGRVVYKKSFTTDEFKKRLQIAQISGSPVAMAKWNTTFMMNPMTAEGLVLPNIMYWESKPDVFDREFCVVDTKTKGSDAFVAFNVKVFEGVGYVTNIFFDNGDMVGMTNRLVDWIEKNDITNIDIETNAAGALYSLNIKDEIRNRGVLCKVDEHFTSRNKHDRIMASVETIATEFRFDPNGDNGYRVAVDQMQSYTSDGRAMHDDVIDCAALSAEKLKKQNKRPSIIITGKVF